MREINAIVVHCTATRASQPFNVAAIRAMHKARGFTDIGYHWLIGVNGEVWRGRPEEKVGAHVAGFNAFTIGVSYVGGLDAGTAMPRDTRTPSQVAAMQLLLRDLVKRYPKAVIVGHRDFSPDRDGDGKVEPHEWLKACPCFDAGAWAAAHGLPAGRIVKGKPLPWQGVVQPSPPAAVPRPVPPPRPPQTAAPGKTDAAPAKRTLWSLLLRLFGGK